MTVSTEVNQAAYTGNGVTTVFPYTFRILNSANLTVTRVDLLEVETVLTLGTDYTVTGAGSYNGGSVTLINPLPNGYGLIIERDLSAVQETDLRNQGTFFAEVHEDAFDYLTMLIQQALSWVGLSLKRPNSRSSFYDAKQYRIANLANPSGEQDAVNNRSMKSYVDQAISGVIGGFGWFLQAGAGAVYRTFQSKMRESVSILDFGGNPSNSSANNSSALANAAAAAGEGGTVTCPAGIYRFVGATNITPVNILGDGQGSTIFEFDNSSGLADGIVFNQPTKLNVEFGICHITLKTIGGNGRYCIDTTGVSGFNHLYPKQTFEHLSFSSSNTNDPAEEFSQVYSWQFMMHLGDSWQMKLNAIDAQGSYKPSVDPSLQTLDGFVRFNPNQGILSCRISGVTVHNIANCFEIRQKTFVSFVQVDMARCYKGVYDAPDRIYETGNPYAYGEISFDFVVINAQRACWDLSYRYGAGFVNCIATRTGEGFETGAGWDGFRLPFARFCHLTGVTVNHPNSFDTASSRNGFFFAGGHSCSVNGANVGGLSTGFNLTSIARPVEGGVSGPVRSLSITGVAISGNLDTVFNIDTVRHLSISQFGSNNFNGYTYSNFATYGTDVNNSYTFGQIEASNEFTHSSIKWRKDDEIADGKGTRISLASGLVISTETDTGSIGSNWLIMNRTGTVVNSVELRSNTTNGYVLLTGNNVAIASYIKPTTDNTFSNGNSAFRWSTVYAGTGSINTSDAREKTPVRILTDGEIATGLQLAEEVGTYAWMDRVYAKNQDARIHFGMTVQRAIEIFSNNGLDAFDYGAVCFDAWEESQILVGAVLDEQGNEITPARLETIPPGDRFSFRPDQISWLISGALRANQKKLEERLKSLESKISM